MLSPHYTNQQSQPSSLEVGIVQLSLTLLSVNNSNLYFQHTPPYTASVASNIKKIPLEINIIIMFLEALL